ncbi:MAG: type I methionyl aminopeptidase [Clostridia bacterium]
MITIKNNQEIELMRISGKIAKSALIAAGKAIKPGVTTAEIDKIVRKTIEDAGAIPSFLGYGGFPASACISINEEVIHGIPSGKVINDGDIVSVDVGAYINGFHGDCAMTFACGNITPEAKRLIDVTRQSFYEGIKFAKVGNRISDISHAIQTYAEGQGFSVVKKFIGHGIGADLHESPEVPNYGNPGRGPRLQKGMTIAIEPMINEGSLDVVVLRDGWTVETIDKKLSAHYENTVLITDGEPEILTYHSDDV